DAAHDVYFAFLEANLLFDLALSDHRLLNAADVLVGVNRRDIHGEFQGYLVEPVHVRCDVDIYADVNIVELSVNQRVDADAADAGLERTAGHGYTLADLQRSLLTIRGTDLRLLDELAAAVTHQEIRRGGRDRHLEVRGVQVGETIQVDAARCASCRGGGAGRAGRRATGGRAVVLQLYGDTTGRLDAEIAHLVAGDLHDRNFHHYLGPRLVEIGDQLLGHRNLIGRSPHDDCLLRRKLLQALGIEQSSQNINQVL